MSVFKAFRAIRILKLTRYNSDLRKLIKQTMRSLIAIGNFSILLVLFLFIWSILGMELFAYRAVMDEDHNFISAEEAM